MTDFLDNLLGAVSLAVVDDIEAACAAALPLGGQAAGALILLDLRPRMTIKRLAQRLRLSHPGAVRLAERLAAAGLVRREAGEDKRTVRLTLTEAGTGQVERLRQARGARLAAVAQALSSAEQAALTPILEKLMAQLTTGVVSAYANCRLCDIPACQARGCPVDALARAPSSQPEA